MEVAESVEMMKNVSVIVKGLKQKFGYYELLGMVEFIDSLKIVLTIDLI